MPLPASPHEPGIVFLSSQKRLTKPAKNSVINAKAQTDKPNQYPRKKRIGLIAIEIITAIVNLAGSKRFLKSNKLNIYAHTYPGNTNTNGKRINARREPKISWTEKLTNIVFLVVLTGSSNSLIYKKNGIILKFHRTLLCPLITTKIERIPPFGKGGPGGISEAINMKIPLDPPFPKGEVSFSYMGWSNLRKIPFLDIFNQKDTFDTAGP